MCNSICFLSPLGEILLTEKDSALSGAYFVGQKHFPALLDIPGENTPSPILTQAKAWLEEYFAGKNPPIPFPLAPEGTGFQKLVWAQLLKIPYGKTVSYGHLAKEAARQMGKRTMSAQAVGNAVGRNPISIFIPCHRVLGAGGQLTGYAAGTDRKAALLRLETVDIPSFL